MSEQTEHPESERAGADAADSPVESAAFAPEEAVPAEPDETEVPGAGTGQRTTQAQTMSDDERSQFQDHWDEFPGH